ncbi:MAG: hypothetical protein KC550_03205 [Nanoarchaeota archaeon]|nr:hypothetical protein [Nanoarchaeota archaeon]
MNFVTLDASQFILESDSMKERMMKRKMNRAKVKRLLIKLINEGLIMSEIGERLGGLSRANIEVKLKSLGLKDLYHEVREKIESEKQDLRNKELEEMRADALAKSNLRRVLYQLAIKKAVENGNLPMAKALEYRSQYKFLNTNIIPLKNLAKLFDIYYRRNGDNDFTLNVAADFSRINFTQINEILDGVNLPKIRSRRNYKGKRTLEQMVYLENVVNKTDFSVSDICYFLWGEDRQNVLGKIKRVRGSNDVNFLIEGMKGSSYSNLSLVYEANDAGLDELETRKLFSRLDYIHYDDISQVLEMRSELEPKIIAELRKVFPNEKITKAYIPSDLRVNYFENYSKPLN